MEFLLSPNKQTCEKNSGKGERVNEVIFRSNFEKNMQGVWDFSTMCVNKTWRGHIFFKESEGARVEHWDDMR